MRIELDRARVDALLRALGAAAKGPGRIYLTGGTSAVMEGWRSATVDADLKLDPEPAGIFAALERIKDALHVNIELASPEDFVPEVPGWRERSRFIDRFGPVDFYHYDFYAQALSKIERGFDRDLADVREMVSRGLVEPTELRAKFDEIQPALERYPSVDRTVFRDNVVRFLAELQS